MKSGNFARKIAIMGVLTACMLAFSYIEVLIPIPTGIPGIKIGLANIIVMFSVYRLKKWETLLLVVLKALLCGILFGNVMSLAYSLCGGLLSFLIMLMLLKTSFFSIVGVSVVGGITHNVGQILCACFLLRTKEIIWYLPILLVSGCLCGTCIGILSGLFVKRIPKIFNN